MISSEVAQAYDLAKSGEKVKAQNLLISVVKSNDNNEEAWLLLAMLIEPQEKKLRCLQKVLQINPSNEKAKRAVTRLKQGKPENASKRIQAVSSPQKQEFNQPLVAPTTILESSKNSKTYDQISDRQLLEHYVSQMTTQGWNVITLTDTSVQLRKPKVWSATLLILGTLGIVVFGLGLLLIVLAVLDYVLKKDEIKFTTVQELRQNLRIEYQNQAGSSQVSSQKSKSLLNDPLFWVVTVMILVFLCTLSSMLN